jgi:hypothetical protein
VEGGVCVVLRGDCVDINVCVAVREVCICDLIVPEGYFISSPLTDGRRTKVPVPVGCNSRNPSQRKRKEGN